jgi:hypothetical protein
MSVHICAKILDPIVFHGGYVQASKSLRGPSWRVSVYLDRRLPSGRAYQTRAATRVRRSEDAARKIAAEMAAFWSKDNPDFAVDRKAEHE